MDVDLPFCKKSGLAMDFAKCAKACEKPSDWRLEVPLPGLTDSKRIDYGQHHPVYLLTLSVMTLLCSYASTVTQDRRV